MTISPAALLATIVARRPLWALSTVRDWLDLSTPKVCELIDNGALPFCFDVGCSKRKRLVRVLASSVVEYRSGPLPGIGSAKNLGLPEVIDLILPKRNMRSTELERLFSASHQQIWRLADELEIVTSPAVKDGPNSAMVLSRASVSKFLTKRRIL